MPVPKVKLSKYCKAINAAFTSGFFALTSYDISTVPIVVPMLLFLIGLVTKEQQIVLMTLRINTCFSISLENYVFYIISIKKQPVKAVSILRVFPKETS
ncbi:hypothetical protein GCM10028861_09050 [Flavobacterium koreense]